jgi:hypothetical protein
VRHPALPNGSACHGIVIGGTLRYMFNISVLNEVLGIPLVHEEYNEKEQHQSFHKLHN